MVPNRELCAQAQRMIWEILDFVWWDHGIEVCDLTQPVELDVAGASILIGTPTYIQKAWPWIRQVCVCGGAGAEPGTGGPERDAL